MECFFFYLESPKEPLEGLRSKVNLEVLFKKFPSSVGILFSSERWSNYKPQDLFSLDQIFETGDIASMQPVSKQFQLSEEASALALLRKYKMGENEKQGSLPVKKYTLSPRAMLSEWTSLGTFFGHHLIEKNTSIVSDEETKLIVSRIVSSLCYDGTSISKEKEVVHKNITTD